MKTEACFLCHVVMPHYGFRVHFSVSEVFGYNSEDGKGVQADIINRSENVCPSCIARQFVLVMKQFVLNATKWDPHSK